MKQLRWIIILAAAAAVLTAVYLIVDAKARERDDKIRNTSAPKQLIYEDPSTVTRITLDNEEGHFAFDWDAEKATWVLTSSEQFPINTYAVSAICNYLCQARSLKTVAPDCENTAPFGFEHPVTLKLYTQKTGMENPIVLYVGDSTPTYDAYYAMLEGDRNVYTIDTTSGGIFLAAKDTLKDRFLFDTYGVNVTYYKQETVGQVGMEISRNDDTTWSMKAPAGFSATKSRTDNLMETIVRVTLESFVEENPSDLKKYGLDSPWAKIWLRGKDMSGIAMRREIWFGADVEHEDGDAQIYGYFADTRQVFTILRSNTAFAKKGADEYIVPYCTDVSVEKLSQIEIDMGDVYPMHETLHLDYANEKYALGDRDISGMNDSNILTLFQNYYRSIAELAFTSLDLDAKPEGEPAVTIAYTFTDGHKQTLTFLRGAEQNQFYLMRDGVYTGMVLRLNRFTSDNSITPSYEALMNALRKKQQ